MHPRSRSHPEGHLQLDGGAGARVPERKALSQRHVLLGQQDVQRHRQVPQRALVLVVFHLREKHGGEMSIARWRRRREGKSLFGEGRDEAVLSAICAAVPPTPAPASWGCGRGMINNLPTEAPWFCSGSLKADREPSVTFTQTRQSVCSLSHRCEWIVQECVLSTKHRLWPRPSHHFNEVARRKDGGRKDLFMLPTFLPSALLFYILLVRHFPEAVTGERGSASCTRV